MLAVVGSALAGLRPMKDAGLFVAITIGAYLISTVLEYLWNLLFRAPVAVHAGLIAEICKIGDNARKEIHSERESAESILREKVRAIDDGKQRISALEAEISRKQPHDEHKEALVRDALGELGEQDRAVLLWLLDNGRVRRGIIQARGFYNVDGLNDKAGLALIVHDDISGEMNAYHQINPEYKDALRNVLYPPRSVTPPQV